MPIRAVAYASEAIREIAADGLGQTEGKLCAIVDDAARFNRNAGVTGVLLFDGEHFLQYLEGPEDGLSVAYSRVIGASSHTGLVELQRGRVGHRRLPFWPMRWLPAELHELGRIAKADWTDFAQGERTAEQGPSGMDLLMGAVKQQVAAI